MKKPFLYLSFMVLSFAAQCQKTQKLYHTNGNIAFEGKFTMVWTETEPFEYLDRISPGNIARLESRGDERGKRDALYIYKDIIPNRLYQGKCKFYFTDGSLMAEGTYKNGYKHGDFKLYHSNGKLSAKQSYVNGMADGKWESWDENGNLTTMFFYQPIPENWIDEFSQYIQLESEMGRRAERDKAKQFFSSMYVNWEDSDLFRSYKNPVLKYQDQNLRLLKSRLKKINIYSKGFKQGTFKVWENKQLVLQMDFKDNQPDGKWIVFQNGNPTFEMDIKNDSVIAAKDYLQPENNYGTPAYNARYKKDEEQRRAYENDAIAVDLAGLSSGNGVGPAPMTATPKKTNENEIFRVVQQKASPPYDWQKYLSQNLKYPEAALKDSIQGRVSVEVVIERDGSISNVKVVRGKELGFGLPEAAINVVKVAPKWIPAKENGKPVRCYIIMPIHFKLD